MRSMAFRGVLTILACMAPALAQNQPVGAHVNLYFPHLVDGGVPTSLRWQTTFTFMNSGTGAATVDLFLYKDNGAAWTLDLGLGTAASHFTFQVPAGSTTILKSAAASPTSDSGRAEARSNVPITGIVAFRSLNANTPKFELSAQSTLPVLEYNSPASPYMGVALGNIYTSDSITVTASYYVNGTLSLGPVDVPVPALGHTAFNLSSVFGSGASSIAPGVLVLKGKNQPHDIFVAWTVGGDATGTLSSLPPGAFVSPVSDWDQIYLSALTMIDILASKANLAKAPGVATPISTTAIDAFYDTSTNLNLSFGVSQLFSDSPSELNWLAGHLLGHIYQDQTGKFEFSSDSETDADVWGVYLNMAAGYEPYAIAGALEKLSMAAGNGMIVTGSDGFAFENFATPALLKASVDARLAKLFTTLKNSCSDVDLGKYCTEYKQLIHPNLPTVAPFKYNRSQPPKSNR